MTMILLLFVSVFLTSCDQDNKAMLLGVWESDQISQSVGSYEELAHYNYLEITETKINAKSFYLASIEGGTTQKKYSEEDNSMNYQWKNEKEILVENSLFEIELKKNEMVLKNKNIEIHYNKKG